MDSQVRTEAELRRIIGEIPVLGVIPSFDSHSPDSKYSKYGKYGKYGGKYDKYENYGYGYERKAEDGSK